MGVRGTVSMVVAACTAFLGASHPSPEPHAPDPLWRLVETSGAYGRDIPLRLSGNYPWAPLRAARNSAVPAPGDDRMALRAAAADVYRTATYDNSPAAGHALAVAEILLGNPRAAVKRLESLAGSAADVASQTDRGVAQYLVATRDDEPSRLGKALAATDAALQTNPASAEARFNRALIIETLGLRDTAREEWDRYLHLDPDSAWAVEARQHANALAPVEPFDRILARGYERLLADPVQARALVRQYPQDARIAGEEDILARWGEAAQAGQESAASKHIALAREIGAELAADGSDGLLASLVAAIDRAGPVQRSALAQAHVHFRQGRQLYRKRDLVAAEGALTAATAEFVRGNSDGELMARAFTANTIYEEHRISEASDRLQVLLAATPQRYPVLRAHMQWELGGVALAASRWGECIAALTESLAGFDRAGDQNYAAVVRGELAYVYDRVGQPSAAWKDRMIALRELGRRPTSRLQESMYFVTQAALSDSDWSAALSFLTLEIDVARRVATPIVEIEALLSQAEVNVRIGHRREAAADMKEARRMIDALSAPADRTHFDAIAKGIEAQLAADPATAVSLLTSSIDFHAGSAGRRMRLPQLLAERARAFRAMGNDARAAEDLESGVAELERHRASLPSGDDRWGVFHAADDLFGEAISLALAHDDAARAFTYAERARARALLDTLGSPWPHVTPADVPPGTTIVEYVLQPDGIIIFTVDGHGIEAVRHRVERQTLLDEITAFAEAAASADESLLRRTGRGVYRRLIEPIETKIAGARTLALVPDPRLAGIPFAALVGGAGRYLVEDYALTVEPSAAVFARLRTSRPSKGEQQLLIVTGADDSGKLPAVDHETREVARSYSHVRRLGGAAATPAAFTREAASANVIHFSGHALASDGTGQQGCLLLKGDGTTDGRLDVKQIAAMHLPRTSLIVLAACATAAGEIRSTEGTISVARAFLAAGVPSVIATLRPIEDEAAAELFPVLHRHLARGLAPADALRETQIEWIRSRKDPALWSAIQVIGE